MSSPGSCGEQASEPGSTWGGGGKQGVDLPEMVTVCKKCVLSCSIHSGEENISSRAKPISLGNPSLYSFSLQISLALGFRASD